MVPKSVFCKGQVGTREPEKRLPVGTGGSQRAGPTREPVRHHPTACSRDRCLVRRETPTCVGPHRDNNKESTTTRARLRAPWLKDTKEGPVACKEGCDGPIPALQPLWLVYQCS